MSIDAVNQISNLSPENLAVLQKLLTDINNQSSGVLYGTTTPTTMDYGKTTVVDNGTAASRKVVFKSGQGNLVTLNSVLTITSQAAGDILYFDGTSWVRLAKGTALQGLRMKADASIPEWGTPALSSYDSGWFAVEASTDYTKTHSLGTVKVLTSVYWASSDAGAEMQLAEMPNSALDTAWVIAHNITTTTVDISVGSAINHINDDGTRTAAAADGYARVIMLAV